MLSTLGIAAHSQVVGPYSATPGGEPLTSSASPTPLTSPGLGLGTNSVSLAGASNSPGIGSNVFGLATNQFQTNGLTPTPNTNASSRIMQNTPATGSGGASAPARQ